MANINKEYLQAAINLYDYMDYTNVTYDELLDTINADWECNYLTDHDGKDGKVYLWYLDESRSVAICVNDNTIISDERDIIKIILGY